MNNIEAKQISNKVADYAGDYKYLRMMLNNTIVDQFAVYLNGAADNLHFKDFFRDFLKLGFMCHYNWNNDQEAYYYSCMASLAADDTCKLKTMQEVFAEMMDYQYVNKGMLEMARFITEIAPLKMKATRELSDYIVRKLDTDSYSVIVKQNLPFVERGSSNCWTLPQGLAPKYYKKVVDILKLSNNSTAILDIPQAV